VNDPVNKEVIGSQSKIKFSSAADYGHLFDK
jgi:hypothetical protein